MAEGQRASRRHPGTCEIRVWLVGGRAPRRHPGTCDRSVVGVLRCCDVWCCDGRQESAQADAAALTAARRQFVVNNDSCALTQCDILPFSQIMGNKRIHTQYI